MAKLLTGFERAALRGRLRWQGPRSASRIIAYPLVGCVLIGIHVAFGTFSLPPIFFTVSI